MNRPAPIRNRIAHRPGVAARAPDAVLLRAHGRRSSRPGSQSPLRASRVGRFASARVVLDRAVAVVNRHVILASDLDDEIRLSVLDPNRVGQGELTQQQALEQLISRALIEQQIRQEDMQAIEPSQQEVNARLDELRKQLPACVRQNCASDAGWNAFLELARTHDRARRSVSSLPARNSQLHRAAIPAGHSKSPSSRSQTYYHDTLLPQYAPGESIPPLDQVAPRIQEILLEQQVNVLFDNWLNNLRQQGDVEVLAPKLAPAPETPAAPAASGKGGL